MLHGCYDVTRLGKHEQSSEVLDFWSDDTKQDTFFTQSAMDIYLPGWKGHFQDSLGYVDDVFHIKLLFVSIAKFLNCCLISAKPFISTDFSGTKAYDHQLIS